MKRGAVYAAQMAMVVPDHLYSCVLWMCSSYGDAGSANPHKIISGARVLTQTRAYTHHTTHCATDAAGLSCSLSSKRAQDYLRRACARAREPASTCTCTTPDLLSGHLVVLKVPTFHHLVLASREQIRVAFRDGQPPDRVNVSLWW